MAVLRRCRMHQRDDCDECYDWKAEVKRLREEIKRLAWCGQGPLNCVACKERIEALGISRLTDG